MGEVRAEEESEAAGSPSVVRPRFAPELPTWYATRGRHELPWRDSRDRWEILVAEVMLCQTQVGRVAPAWREFIQRFPTPAAAAGAPAGELIETWGRLGYPRRALWLHEAAKQVASTGWPEDLTALRGVGQWVARAVGAQVDDEDSVGVDVNTRRLAQRTQGRLLSASEITEVLDHLGEPLAGRHRLWALLDLAAQVCTPRAPACSRCPLRSQCATRGELARERPRAQKPYEGSLRQRRGVVLALLREHAGEVVAEPSDQEAVESLVRDGLVVRSAHGVSLP